MSASDADLAKVAQDAMQTAMRRKELVMKVMGQQQQGAAKAKAPHIDEDTVLEDTMRDDVDDIDILLKDLDAQMQESQQIQEATQKSPRDEATEAPRQGVEKPPEVTTGKDPAGQGVEKPPEVTTGKDPAGQGVEKPQEVTTEKDPAGRGVEKPGLEVTAEKDPGQGVEKPLEVKAEKDPGQGVEKPQADSEKASVQGEVQAGSAESHLVSWLLTSLKGHQGSGSGTGEPSAIEQALKRPGTVDFEQLLAGLNNKINAGTKQQDGKLPAPQDEVPPSAPSTPAPTTPAQSIAAENAPMKAPASIEPDRADAPMKPPAAIEPDVVEDRKLKRNAYMRFSRSLTSPNCPEAVLEAYDKCKDSTGRARRDKVQELFQKFLDCREQWGESEIVMTAETRSISRNRTAKKWMTRKDRSEALNPKPLCLSSLIFIYISTLSCRTSCRSTATKAWSTTSSKARNLASIDGINHEALCLNLKFLHHYLGRGRWAMDGQS
ncbi:unnamed protein product [Symbiodinium sp. KB8]|nr:unnamed protein product [Symbiodinium sp. KB8]